VLRQALELTRRHCQFSRVADKQIHGNAGRTR
jgi:hypothetical protein